MNSALMMMLGQRGRLDPATLRKIVTSGNEKRRKLFTKLGDLLFGLFMLIFGQLKLKDAAGKDIDLSKPGGMSIDDKLNTLLTAQDSTQKSVLFREFLRPAIVSIAELVASMMEPDEMMLQLMAGGSQDGSGGAAMGGGFGTSLGGDIGQAEAMSGAALSAQGVSENRIFVFGTPAEHDNAVYVRQGNRARWGKDAATVQRYAGRSDYQNAIIYVPWTQQANILLGPTVQ